MDYRGFPEYQGSTTASPFESKKSNPTGFLQQSKHQQSSTNSHLSSNIENLPPSIHNMMSHQRAVNVSSKEHLKQFSNEKRIEYSHSKFDPGMDPQLQHQVLQHQKVSNKVLKGKNTGAGAGNGYKDYSRYRENERQLEKLRERERELERSREQLDLERERERERERSPRTRNFDKQGGGFRQEASPRGYEMREKYHRNERQQLGHEDSQLQHEKIPFNRSSQRSIRYERGSRESKETIQTGVSYQQHASKSRENLAEQEMLKSREREKEKYSRRVKGLHQGQLQHPGAAVDPRHKVTPRQKQQSFSPLEIEKKKLTNRRGNRGGKRKN